MPTPEQFLQGVWHTPRGRAPIAAGIPESINLPPILVHASFVTDATAVSYRIDTERGETARRLPEGSQLIVQGRSIELRQAVTGTQGVGWWVALTQPHDMAGVTTSSWAVLPGATAQILDITEPRLFVLTLRGALFSGCNSQPLTLGIVVDGQPLKHLDGTPVRLSVPNSVISYGRQVYVTMIGACTIQNSQDHRFFGTLKISNPR